LNASKKRKANNLEAAWGRQVQAHNTTFDCARWKLQYIKWVVCSGISLRETAATYHNELLAFQNPRVTEILPSCQTTVTAWILQAFNEARPKVAQKLIKATSKLTISFDGWTANNKVLDLLGIVCHYLDENYTRRAVVLGLRDTLGSYTGANMADHLLSVIQCFGISGQIAYFMADNASKNDAALKVLCTYLPSMQLDPVKQRLRCAGHIHNLVSKDHCRIRYNGCLTGSNTLYSTTLPTSISRQSQSCERRRLPCTSMNYLTKVGGIYVIPRDLRSRGLYTIQTPKQSNTTS
jgi:hypothetical protein